MKSIIMILVLFVVSTGCSHTIRERKKKDTDPKDQGSKTELQLRGPRVLLKHSF